MVLLQQNVKMQYFCRETVKLRAMSEKNGLKCTRADPTSYPTLVFT